MKARTHWLLQRFTAVFLCVAMPALGYVLFTYRTYTLRQWQAFWSEPLHASLLVVALLPMFYHAALGFDVVIEDYIPSLRLRTFLINLVHMGFILLFMLAVASLIKLGRGAVV